MVADLWWWFVERGVLVPLGDALHLAGIASFRELDDRPGECWRRHSS